MRPQRHATATFIIAATTIATNPLTRRALIVSESSAPSGPYLKTSDSTLDVPPLILVSKLFSHPQSVLEELCWENGAGGRSSPSHRQQNETRPHRHSRSRQNHPRLRNLLAPENSAYNVELVTEVARQSPFPVNAATTLEGQLWILHAQIVAELDAARRAPTSSAIAPSSTTIATSSTNSAASRISNPGSPGGLTPTRFSSASRPSRSKFPPTVSAPKIAPSSSASTICSTSCSPLRHSTIFAPQSSGSTPVSAASGPNASSPPLSRYSNRPRQPPATPPRAEQQMVLRRARLQPCRNECKSGRL